MSGEASNQAGYQEVSDLNDRKIPSTKNIEFVDKGTDVTFRCLRAVGVGWHPRMCAARWANGITRWPGSLDTVLGTADWAPQWLASRSAR